MSNKTKKILRMMHETPKHIWRKGYMRERDAETVDDLIRLEGECDDAILVADSLAKEGVGAMLEVAGLLRHAKRLTVERLLRMETQP